jgi:invasion protein IalB
MVRIFIFLLVLTLLASADARAQRAPTPANAWLKWCYEGAVTSRDKDGKEERTDVNVCATFHEHIDPDTGVLLSVVLWQIQEQTDGKDMRHHLQVTVPLGSQLQPGLRVAVFPKGRWENAKKIGKFPEDEYPADYVELRYSRCNSAGCTEALEATPELVASLEKGGGLVVQASSASRAPVTFRVPLAGFTQALADERALPRRTPRYEHPTRCDTVVDYKGPCGARSLLKRWPP